MQPWPLFIENLWGISQLVFSVNKGPFREPLGISPTPHSDSAQIWGSNRLGSWTRSGWGADKKYKCVFIRCAWIFTYTVVHQAHVCFYCIFDLRTCVCFLWILSTFQFYNHLYSFCALWKCIFEVVNELMGVWRCWIPVTICERNLIDNIDEVHYI